ncbi:GAF domain-containing protein [Solirubrobacter phytolaccae]|uniref:GAF domain-containing protein n=1 Tax=Solirubrobacter phytolaccae TaxID=1404360 RepID=A0A9X3N4D6_9ACTN|nr:GAF domain-containing protein [Solirubrobacter phytolaccae]MDA0179414.1 GAF domain-containing protein [Solirubrobacter phytolaccae]
MSQNSWLAVDAGTTPLVRAQELRFAWERFIADDDGDPTLVREAITDSWKRSSAAGVDPMGSRLAPVVADEDETHDRYEEHLLHTAAPLIHDCLSAIADEAGYLIVISDADGTLMSVEGSANMRMRAAGDMNFAEGTDWSEGGAGTNAIGTALALDHAVQVFGPEHFSDPVQRWTCSACPIHDPDTGEVIGVIDLTGELSTVHPHSLAVATATARAVEASLQLALQERDARLHARYGARVSPDRSALVTRSGRAIGPVPRGWNVQGRLVIPPGGGELTLPSGALAVAEPVSPTHEAFVVHALESKRVTSIARPLVKLHFLGRDRAELEVEERTTTLRPRLAEILALLCSSPDGMSAERLCADLHGDGGSVSSVRVEVSRLRKLLGPWIDTDRYRLTCDVESDVRRVEALLAAGQTRAAAEAYAGPLLPSSEAPGIVRERERLDRWLHQAVMTAEDVEALWAYVQTTPDDLGAWKRLLTQLEFRDPRRPQAAARVGELRAALM